MVVLHVPHDLVLIAGWCLLILSIPIGAVMTSAAGLWGSWMAVPMAVGGVGFWRMVVSTVVAKIAFSKANILGPKVVCLRENSRGEDTETRKRTLYLVTPHFVFCDQFLSRFPDFCLVALGGAKKVTVMMDKHLDFSLRTALWQGWQSAESGCGFETSPLTGERAKRVLESQDATVAVFPGGFVEASWIDGDTETIYVGTVEYWLRRARETGREPVMVICHLAEPALINTASFKGIRSLCGSIGMPFILPRTPRRSGNASDRVMYTRNITLPACATEEEVAAIVEKAYLQDSRTIGKEYGVRNPRRLKIVARSGRCMNDSAM